MLCVTQRSPRFPPVPLAGHQGTAGEPVRVGVSFFTQELRRRKRISDNADLPPDYGAGRSGVRFTSADRSAFIDLNWRHQPGDTAGASGRRSDRRDAAATPRFTSWPWPS